MKSQNVSINSEPRFDESIIHIVNEHHDQVVAERRRQSAAALAEHRRQRAVALVEQQKRIERRYLIAYQVLGGLICAALGAIAAFSYIALAF